MLAPSLLTLALWAAPQQAPDTSFAKPAAETSAPPSAGESAPLPEGDALAINADFIEGRRLYENFEFEKASFRFRAATRAPLHDVERARALVWLGVAQGQAGDAIAAKESFASALALDATSTLPLDAPPTLEPVFTEARATPREAPAPTAPPPPAVASPADGPSLPMVVGAILTGAGVLIVGGGAGVGALASGQATDAANERFQDDAIAGYDSAQSTALVANGLLVVGGAAVGTGVAVLVGAALLSE